MRHSELKIHLSVSAAVIALVAGTFSVAAEDEMVVAAVADSSRNAGDSAASGNAAPSVATDSLHLKVAVPTHGLYRLEAPSGSDIRLSVDGVLTLDTTGPLSADGPTTAILTLSPGDHTIEVTGPADALARLADFTFGRVGEAPQPIDTVGERIAAAEAAKINATRTALNAPGDGPRPDPAAAPGSAPNGLPGMIGGGSGESFTIGGNSSQARLNPPAAAPGAGGPAAAGMAAGGMSGFGLPGRARAPMAPVQSSTTTVPSTVSSGGASGAAGSSSGTGGGTTTPAPGGTPTAGSGTPPPPTPTPTPTPTPAPTPTPETVQVSPLVPPADTVLTQAVQLTSAGNVNGQVSNGGATLFGAVMDNAMFDIVEVAISSSNRTTTVDVGPQTGQFAVRLFPEDLSSGPVQVTLTGASSASDEVEAQPVSYTVTPMQAQDGVSQALSRLTFGPTPELYARVRAIGFQNYLEEQLNPGAINDQAFNAMNPNALLSPTTTNEGEMFRSLVNYDIAHAAFSERQLQEVMGHFWANHFHAVTKDTDMRQQNITDRQFFRDNAFGNFEDLLLYSARSPLMSQYLDNDQNRRNNINENYGREILELSTVGVEAGYGPDDVIAVSRVFTGWAYERTNPNANGVASVYAFEFFPERHDEDDKFIPFLNTTIAGRSGEAGVQEGEELVAILAQHPFTRTRTCGKIVALLVADQPPQRFVDACVAAWTASGGEISDMLRAILQDPTYITNADYQRNKAKTPFEYAVSTIRAFGARPDNANDDDFFNNFRDTFESAGQNYLRFPVPTGLPEVASAWLNSATMVASYTEITDVAERRQNYNIDLNADITEAGLETAEEVAAYLLTVATADNFRREEFEAVVEVLKGDDGIFEPRTQDETRALEKAMGLIVVTPSFQIQ